MIIWTLQTLLQPSVFIIIIDLYSHNNSPKLIFAKAKEAIYLILKVGWDSRQDKHSNKPILSAILNIKSRNF